MDTRVPPDDAGWRRESTAKPRGAPPERGVEQRLEAIEDGLAAIDDRLSILEARLTQTVADAIGEELHGVSDDLRRAVSDLGRLMLRDLDRLTKLLGEHRDDIVARLYAESTVQETVAELMLEEPDVSEPEDTEPPPTAPAGEEGRKWVRPGRKKRAGGDPDAK